MPNLEDCDISIGSIFNKEAAVSCDGIKFDSNGEFTIKDENLSANNEGNIKVSSEGNSISRTKNGGIQVNVSGIGLTFGGR